MDTFFENARRLYDSAGAASGEPADFAVLVRNDGGLHFVMETPLTLDAAWQDAGAKTAYRVTRSQAGLRVEGMEGGRRCLIEDEKPRLRSESFLHDAPRYRITSPLLISDSARGSCGGVSAGGMGGGNSSAVASRMYLA